MSSGEPEPLAGGRGLAWRAGDIVFKPADLAPDGLAWQADVLPAVDAREVRLSIPQRTIDGDLVVDGWTAWSFLAGEHRAARWPDVIAVGDRFHRALAGLERPAFLDARTRSVGDRRPGRLGRSIRRAVSRRPACRADSPIGSRASKSPSQLIHGDLTGNVLFAEGLPPAVIDLSMYWRPPAFATAVVVADALVWEGADESLLESIGEIDDFGQMLARALIYRLVAAVEGGFEDDAAAIDRRYGPTVEKADRARHLIDIATAYGRRLPCCRCLLPTESPPTEGRCRPRRSSSSTMTRRSSGSCGPTWSVTGSWS